MNENGDKTSKKRIVVLGGGTGTYQVLSGLKKYPLDIYAIISMCDSGGSTGRLRKELGILPPGDVRRAILALSDLPFARNTLSELFNFRFENGESLKGHSVGNILLAALAQITGSMDKAIAEAARILHSSGNVYPVTLENADLVAILTDGTRVFGETNVDRRRIKPFLPIDKIYLTPSVEVYDKSKTAIEKADMIVISPGDLYTSILPIFLVNGVIKAIKKSSANILWIMNLMTKKGETDNFKASNFLMEIERYLGEVCPKMKYILVNKKIRHSKDKVTLWYKKYGCIPVKNDLKKGDKYKIIEKDFLSKTTFFRHDPDKLARVICSVLGNKALVKN